MRQLWLFLKNYHAFFLFLILEIIAIGFLFTRSSYQQAKFLNSSGKAQAKVNELRSSVTDYFGLRKENEELAVENKLLKEKLAAFEHSSLPIQDSVLVDSVQTADTTIVTAFDFKVAKVISNPMNTSNSLITINKGSADSLHLQDGILSPSGVVGKVVQVSEHYSLVMPLFHPNSRLNVKHKKSNYNGNLVWYGTGFETLRVENIPRNASVEPGDTIITNQYSKSFPERSMVGIVEDRKLDANGNFYQMNVRPTANFFRLDYVYIVQRKDLEEILELESRAEK